MTRAMTQAQRAQALRAAESMLEDKRQALLNQMSADDRSTYRHYDVGTMIALVRSGRITLPAAH